MSQATKPKQPRFRKHRLVIELTSNPNAVDRLVLSAAKRYQKMLLEEEKYRDWVEQKVIEGMIEKANQSLEPDKQTDTLTLYTQDGQYQFTVERQNKRFMDGRAHQAKALIEEWLTEKEAQSDMDADTTLVYDFLKSMFFGSQQKQFRWTPQLMKFITMDPRKIHDQRLKKAQALLADSIRVNRSTWYSHVYKLDQETGEYNKLTASDSL